MPMIVLMALQFALIRTDANIIDLTLNLRRKVLLGAFSSALSVGLGMVVPRSVRHGDRGLGRRVHRRARDAQRRLPADDRADARDPPRVRSERCPARASPRRALRGRPRGSHASSTPSSWVALVARCGRARPWWSRRSRTSAGCPGRRAAQVWNRLRRVARLREPGARDGGAAPEGRDLHGEHGRRWRRTRDAKLAGGIAERGYHVDLVLSRAEGHYLEEVPATVRIVDLGAIRGLTSLPGLDPVPPA